MDKDKENFNGEGEENDDSNTTDEQGIEESKEIKDKISREREEIIKAKDEDVSIDDENLEDNKEEIIENEEAAIKKVETELKNSTGKDLIVIAWEKK